MSYHSIWSFYNNSVDISREYPPQKIRHKIRAHTLGRCDYSLDIPSPVSVTVPNLIVFVTHYECTYGHPPEKTGLLMSHLSTSLKVIRTDVDQSGTCDFLLMFIATIDLSCNTISKTE